MTNIEKLRREADEVKRWLEELKENLSTISEADKQNKIEWLRAKIDETKQKIQLEINSLSSKTDDTSKQKKEEAEALLRSFEETARLYSSIINPEDSTSKGVIDKTKDTYTTTKDWIWEQWNDVRDKEKWKEEWWMNALRTAWFVATWVWAAALAYKWVKKLWNWAFWDNKNEDEDENENEEAEEKTNKKKKNKEKKEKKDETPFWDRRYGKALKWTGIWTAAYYVSHWIYTKNRWLNDLFDREKGKKLDFDMALDYCKWAIANQDNREDMSYGLNLKYHEDTWEIEAYWERVKINKNNRKIEWLAVDFKKYEHMINTAILIAYLKKNYSWKCANNTPFHLTGSRQWDINVNTWNGSEEAVDWTGNQWKIVWVTSGCILGIVTWIFWWLKAWAAVWVPSWIVWYGLWDAQDKNNIMNDHMPEVDNENWKKNLQAYLNRLGCWESRNQTAEDVTESPIKKEVVECIETIQGTCPELENRWGRRKLDAIQDPNDERKYTIKAYGRDFSAEITWNEWNRKIKILWISWWNPSIKADMSKWNISSLELPLKEWVYMSSLIGFLLDSYHNKWVDYPRFQWKDRIIANRGIYFNDATDLSFGYDTRVLSEEKLKERMPTLLRPILLEFLNDWITWENNISIRKKQ